MYRDRLAVEGLLEEPRHGPAVSPAHPWTVRVEEPRDLDRDAVGPVVGHGLGLRVPFGLVVHAAGADGVDVAPVALGLGMDLRVAVDLGGRGEHEAGAL